MTPDQARALFLEHCQPGDRGALERYGEKAAVAAILATVELCAAMAEEFFPGGELWDRDADACDASKVIAKAIRGES